MQLKDERAVLIFSGGLDSTVLLYHLKETIKEVLPLTFYYSQKHSIEIQYAEGTCKRLNLDHKRIDLSPALGYLPSSQTSSMEVPEGHYAEETMKQTVVPNRNMVMLSVAASYAIASKADTVYYAAHAGDHAIYPDCRPEFVEAIKRAFKECDWHPPGLEAPFLSMTKSDVVRFGSGLHVPFERTFSCYKGSRELNGFHCGRCGTCCERQEAFYIAGVHDPTQYLDTEFWKTACKKLPEYEFN